MVERSRSEAVWHRGVARCNGRRSSGVVASVLTHLFHLGASQVGLLGSPTKLSAAMLAPTRSPDLAADPAGILPPVLGGSSLRRRIDLPPTTPVLASAQGEYRGLRLPGERTARHRWHARLDVVLAPGTLLISGNGRIARFAVSEMVAVSRCDSPVGAIRVDLLDGDHLRVTIRDGGTFLDVLRHEIWLFDTELSGTAPGTEWGFGAVPELLTEADALIQDIDARPLAAQDDAIRNRDALDLIRKSDELREDAHLEALRERRRRLLGRD